MTEITINLHDQPCGNCTVCIGRTIGAKHEQERIIKLLEEHDWSYLEVEASEIISVIKGEK